jgi:glycine betaine/proline transport system permease protein
VTLRLDRDTWTWVGLIAFTLLLLALRSEAGWLIVYPKEWVPPIATWLNTAMKWFVNGFGWFFLGISAVLSVPLGWVQVLLHWLPWPVIMAVSAAAAWRASGPGLAIFAVIALAYMLIVGYWDESMNSLSLVAISVPLALVVGFAFGVAGYFSPRAERFILPMLDVLQTIPAFAYLLPIILLFGFGPVVGLIASLLYSFPPMVRNTMLGLRRVPGEVVESGLMSGATGRQLFWQVQVPSALRQLLLGVNQTTMASFSMIIVASIIGGTADIGWEVTQYLRKAAFGECVLSGVVIALMAMVMDRVSYGLATRESLYTAQSLSFIERNREWMVGAAAALVLFLAALVVPWLRDWPEAWVIYPAKFMNQAIDQFVVNYRAAIETIKTGAFYYVMLPTRIGLEQTVSPHTWGFEFTAPLRWGYAVAVAAAAAWALANGRTRLAVIIGFFGTVFFFGLTKLPWPALLAAATFLAWQLDGMRLAAGTFLSLLFMLVAGIWPEAMMSVYLCGIAVVLSFLMGAGLGIWGSMSPRASQLLRPVYDSLQTMPLFVFLIPFVMIFKIGDFTALLAIIAYAFVPAARYTEHGLRNVPEDVIEAATCMGCTKWQLLWQVKLPLALPVIMLGLNQTIMYAVAMLVITALVGTSDLGQRVYIGLGDGDFGVGFVAGIGMAIIAMIADRMTQAWIRSRQQAFGLAPASV